MSGRGVATRPHVLFVDDEPHILSALRRMLRDRREYWDMTFAVGALEALAAVEARSCDVIISDFRMPDTDGGVLLQTMQEHHPRTARVVLSGHTDEGDLLKVLLLAHAFLNKPCQRDELVEAVDLIVELQPTLRNDDIDDLLLGGVAVRRATATLGRLMSVFDSADRSVGAVASVIEDHPACASEVLRTARSASFGVHGTARSGDAAGEGTIRRVADAVAVLGIRNVRSLVLLNDLVYAVSGCGGPLASWAARLHTAATATAGLARRLAGPAPWADDAFAAGLLYEIGQLALAATRPAEFEAYLTDRPVGAGPHLWTATPGAPGVTHAAVGGYLLGRWGLALPVIDVVMKHAGPDPASPPRTVGSAVALAHAVVQAETGPECDVAPEPVEFTRLDPSLRELVLGWQSERTRSE